MMNHNLTLVVADDHPLFRAGLRQALDSIPWLKVVAEAGDGNEALEKIKEFHPDIALLDIRMPKLSGLRVMRELNKAKSLTDIIFLTMYDDEETFDAAMDLGVKGYVLKESAVKDVVNAIETIADGKHYISPTLMNLMVAHRKKAPNREKGQDLVKSLSPTERRILKLIAESKTSKEIANELYISQRTVENHRAHIGTKLQIHGIFSLLKFAIEHKSLL
jgi:DNA-binding NarL/FixJ family response regulator